MNAKTKLDVWNMDYIEDDCEVYKDALNHIQKLADLEWNGWITITEFRDRTCDILTKLIKKESK